MHVACLHFSPASQAVGGSQHALYIWLRSQDTRLKWKADVGEGKLTVKQTVPAGNWALVPNPSERAPPVAPLQCPWS